MRLTPALTALFFTAGAALADGYDAAPVAQGGKMLLHKYPVAHNFCPQGLMPVEMHGIVSCGVPNAGPYVDRAGGKHKKTKAITHSHVKTHAHVVPAHKW